MGFVRNRTESTRQELICRNYGLGNVQHNEIARGNIMEIDLELWATKSNVIRIQQLLRKEADLSERKKLEELLGREQAKLLSRQRA